MELLVWERLFTHLNSQSPVLLSMGGTRNVQIGFEPATQRLFLRVPLEPADSLPPSPYSELQLDVRKYGTADVVEIATTARHLYREFHRFAGLFTEDYERLGARLGETFQGVVARWHELTLRLDLLSDQEQLGLVAELAVLGALLRNLGSEAIAAWTGRMADMPERHDFRLRGVDLEVKATRSNRRQHIIHGLRQLQPTAGHDLFLISMRFESGGLENGRTLGGRVVDIRAMLESDGNALSAFDAKLQTARYQRSDDAHYPAIWVLADTPTIIRVDQSCPRLVPAFVSSVLGDLAARVANDVTYKVDVEGLGQPIDQSEEAARLGLGGVE